MPIQMVFLKYYFSILSSTLSEGRLTKHFAMPGNCLFEMFPSPLAGRGARGEGLLACKLAKTLRLGGWKWCYA
jgi:hypothetical protein